MAFEDWFDVGKPLTILKKKETGAGVYIFADNTACDTRWVDPENLVIDSYHSYGISTEYLIDITDETRQPIKQLLLELHQSELAEMDEKVIMKILEMERYTLNNVRTNMIVHDKRLLSVLCDTHLMEEYLGNREDAIFLSSRVIPTISVEQLMNTYQYCNFTDMDKNGFDMEVVFSKSGKDRYLLKPNMFGKGKGIIYGRSVSTKEWRNALECYQSLQWVVQPVVQEEVFYLNMGKDEFTPMHMVGLLHNLDDQFFGPGVFRGTPIDDTDAQFTVWAPALLDEFPGFYFKGSTSFVEKCDIPTFFLPTQENDGKSYQNIIDALKKKGIALVNCNEASEKCSRYLQQVWEEKYVSEKFQSFISKIATEIDYHYDAKLGTDIAVWDITPSPHSTNCTQDTKVLARSHMGLEFDMHTDSSFKENPPRFMSLYCICADKTGSGLSKIAYGEAIVQKLNELENGKQFLERLRQREWKIKVPLEFRKLQEYITRPLLADYESNPKSKDTLWWFRRDIIIPIDEEQKEILDTVEKVLRENEFIGELPEGYMLIMDNARWFHGRNEVKDPKRMLKRIRFHDLK